MKTRTVVWLISLNILLCGLIAGQSAAQVNVSVSSDGSGSGSFYLGIGNYYKVPQTQVMVIRDRGIPDDELPVVFFISSRARIRPETVIKLRSSGLSWMAISLRYGLGPDVYYFPADDAVLKSPPYGKAYGYYKNKPRGRWKEIVLGDDDVINLVNLRFVSEHYGYSPSEVVKLRSSGKKFGMIYTELKGGKNKSGKSKGKGKK